MDTLLQAFLLAILMNVPNAKFYQNYDKNLALEFYKDLVSTEQQRAYNYTKRIDNSDFFEGNGDTSQSIEIGSYDFIVVGAGTAGSVIARSLTDIPSIRVLLLEAGGPETPFSDIPGMFLFLSGSRLNWGYKTTSQENSCLANEDNKCDYPRGKAIGGCSAINAMNYIRGNREDFNDWERLGNPGWSYEDMLPYFVYQENAHFKGDEGYHGYKGFLDIEQQKSELPLSDVFLKAFREMGMNVIDYNGENQMGIGKAQKLTKNGRRVSGGRAVLEPVLNRQNLDVVLNALATKVLTKNRVAIGVEFVQYGRKYKASARKEVVVSCGTVNTPQLLMLSGIGPKEEIAKHSIPLVKDLPVGQNLKDHLFIPMAFSTNKNFETTLDDAIEQFLDGSGPLTSGGGTSAVSFIQTKSDLPPGVPDVEIMFLSPNSSFPFFGGSSKYAESLTKTNPANTFFAYMIVLKPKSTGSVTLQSNSPIDFPLINTNYLSDETEEDLESIYKGAKFLLNLTQTEALKNIEAAFVDMNIPPCQEYDLYTREYFDCHAKHLGTSIFHPCCTARMGVKVDENAVVDHRLRVHGVKNLRVADASVLPDIISGHLTATVFVIGQRAAEFILRDHYCFK